MFADSPFAAVVLGVLVGAALLAAGAAVALNWRGCGDRYTHWIGGVLPAARRRAAANRTPRLLLENRVIFGVIAAIGAGLLVGGVAALTR